MHRSLLLLPLKLGEALVTFSDQEFSPSAAKKQKLQFHRKRERENDNDNSNITEESQDVSNSFEILDSSRDEITEEEVQEEEDDVRAAKLDCFNFDDMKKATPVKKKGTPSRRASRNPDDAAQQGFLDDGSQYFMYAYRDKQGNELVNIEVQLQGPSEEGDVQVELLELPRNKQGVLITQSLPQTWLSTRAYGKFLKENKPDTYNSDDWRFRCQARQTKILSMRRHFGHSTGVRASQLITGLPFRVEDWTAGDAYAGTGYWFEGWAIERKTKKKSKKKSSSSRRSTRSSYKMETIGFQNILVVQMVNVVKNEERRKSARNKTTVARYAACADTSSSEESPSSSSSGSGASLSSTLYHRNGDDDDISFTGMSFGDPNDPRRESYDTAPDGDDNLIFASPRGPRGR